MEKEYKETLEKQLRLLSERSVSESRSEALTQITYAMCEVVKLLNQGQLDSQQDSADVSHLSSRLEYVLDHPNEQVTIDREDATLLRRLRTYLCESKRKSNNL